MYDRITDDHPAGRIDLPDEIARVAVLFASDTASLTTGAAFAIRGGLLARMSGTPDPRLAEGGESS